MIRARRGLIVEVTENDLLAAGGNPLSQIVKLALKGMALNMASELKSRGVAAVSPVIELEACVHALEADPFVAMYRSAVPGGGHALVEAESVAWAERLPAASTASTANA